MKKVVNNQRFKIKTTGGFSNFFGVMKNSKSKKLFTLKTKSTSIQVTENHEVFVSEFDKVKLKELNIGDTIYTENGLEVIENIKFIKEDAVYDVFHVEKGNKFYAKSNQLEENTILIKNCLLIDEMAFVNRAEEFYEAVYPTISSGSNTKVIITSTPNGLNFFYKMWTDAETCRSDYIAYDVKWYEHPDRNQNWYDSMCKNMNKKSINQELHCVHGDTKITINGKEMKIVDLYDKYLNYKDNRTLINGIAYKQLQKVIKV